MEAFLNVNNFKFSCCQIDEIAWLWFWFCLKSFWKFSKDIQIFNLVSTIHGKCGYKRAKTEINTLRILNFTEKSECVLKRFRFCFYECWKMNDQAQSQILKLLKNQIKIVSFCISTEKKRFRKQSSRKRRLADPANFRYRIFWKCSKKTKLDVR